MKGQHTMTIGYSTTNTITAMHHHFRPLRPVPFATAIPSGRPVFNAVAGSLAGSLVIRHPTVRLGCTTAPDSRHNPVGTNQRAARRLLSQVVLATLPLDTTKTIMQRHGVGLSRAARLILADQGLRGAPNFYRGALPAVG